MVKRIGMILLLFSFSINAKTINFDKEYGIGLSGSKLVNAIKEVIEEAHKNDIIFFDSEIYDLKSEKLTINKPISFVGRFVDIEEVAVAGAVKIFTRFINVSIISVENSNISFKNIELGSNNKSSYMVRLRRKASKENPHQFYKNILFQNVIFRNGMTHILGGNGAGVTFLHVSFLNFSKLGFSLNRNGHVNYHPQMFFKKCLWRPNFNDMDFNTRAVGFDAGNTEYMQLWDHKNTTIEDCKLDGVGLGASSKGKNVIIKNNHFLGYKLYIDMIHLEEFSSNFLIENNLFEHVKPARGIYIDREGQTCKNITIRNNVFKGKYGWIISAYSPKNLVFENNDFTQAEAKDKNKITMDFSYLHGHESELPFPLPMHNVRIRNNPGLDNNLQGKLRYNQLKGDDSNVIEYAKDKIEVIILESRPVSLVDTRKQYRLINKKTKTYLTTSKQEGIVLENKISKKEKDVWIVNFRYPYNYTFQNKNTKNYLEVKRGYTLGDIYNPSKMTTIPAEQVSSYEDTDAQPRFHLIKQIVDGKVYFEMYPGSNERKSRLTLKNDKAVLELTRGRKELKNKAVLKDESLWELVEVK
ncbi:right-handed parallel beta-helix repeat-containing protein [Polaribacter staleyi]|uniref:right-handed parallel beta-helix repeat-containing protein n=1 Tax=Polaribacter staleyi TaxID=2022337 RepID=UPI0031BB466F